MRQLTTIRCCSRSCSCRDENEKLENIRGRVEKRKEKGKNDRKWRGNGVKWMRFWDFILVPSSFVKYQSCPLFFFIILKEQNVEQKRFIFSSVFSSLFLYTPTHLTLAQFHPHC